MNNATILIKRTDFDNRVHNFRDIRQVDDNNYILKSPKYSINLIFLSLFDKIRLTKDLDEPYVVFNVKCIRDFRDINDDSLLITEVGEVRNYIEFIRKYPQYTKNHMIALCGIDLFMEVVFGKIPEYTTHIPTNLSFFTHDVCLIEDKELVDKKLNKYSNNIDVQFIKQNLAPIVENVSFIYETDDDPRFSIKNMNGCLKNSSDVVFILFYVLRLLMLKLDNMNEEEICDVIYRHIVNFLQERYSLGGKDMYNIRVNPIKELLSDNGKYYLLNLITSKSKMGLMTSADRYSLLSILDDEFLDKHAKKVFDYIKTCLVNDSKDFIVRNKEVLKDEIIECDKVFKNQFKWNEYLEIVPSNIDNRSKLVINALRTDRSDLYSILLWITSYSDDEFKELDIDYIGFQLAKMLFNMNRVSEWNGSIYSYTNTTNELITNLLDMNKVKIDILFQNIFNNIECVDKSMILRSSDLIDSNCQFRGEKNSFMDRFADYYEYMYYNDKLPEEILIMITKRMFDNKI